MTCTFPGCFNVQCYICHQSCNYDHFYRHKDRNSRKGCPLNDLDTQRLHETEVRAAEKKTRKRLTKEDPKLDPQLLDTEAPKKTAREVAGDEAAQAREEDIAAGPPEGAAWWLGKDLRFFFSLQVGRGRGGGED